MVAVIDYIRLSFIDYLINIINAKTQVRASGQKIMVSMGTILFARHIYTPFTDQRGNFDETTKN